MPKLSIEIPTGIYNMLKSTFLDDDESIEGFAVAAIQEYGTWLAGQDRPSSMVLILSEKLPSAPRFRLSYRKMPAETLTIRFEMAPPGQPEAFSVYTEGNVRRK